MTWVVGRAIPFGYSVALSDIRVTLPDGREVDCLQKLHPVGPHIALGFAGSVVIGLAMVDRLRRLLSNIEPNHGWQPDVVAEWWPEDARQVFRSFDARAQAGGCHLLMVGAHPSKNNGDSNWAMSYVYRFRSPDFLPELAGNDEIVSVGSGEGVAEYATAIGRLGDGWDFIQMEVMGPGTSAFALMESVSQMVNDNPTPGISRHLHICVAERTAIRLGRNDGRFIPFGDPQFVMPTVARNMAELTEILGLQGEALLDAHC